MGGERLMSGHLIYMPSVAAVVVAAAAVVVVLTMLGLPPPAT